MFKWDKGIVPLTAKERSSIGEARCSQKKKIGTENQQMDFVLRAEKTSQTS
jgi:hypothetical protein